MELSESAQQLLLMAAIVGSPMWIGLLVYCWLKLVEAVSH